jgi:hypothetical protein
MEKFLKNLTASNKQLKNDRASMLLAQTKREKLRIIEELKDTAMNKQYKLTRLYDLSPKTSTDLAYREDFDPKEWAKQTSDLEIEIDVLSMKISTLQSSYDEWFTDEEELPI